MGKRKTDIASMQYEQAIERLQTIVEAIESGQIGLEESLAHYEQGTRLLCHCRGILDRAQEKMNQLQVDSTQKDDAATCETSPGPADDDRSSTSR